MMQEPAPATLCKSCGLCCTGHLFVHEDLEPAEVETARALGLNVVQSNPEKPVFLQPCPLWDGQCRAYTHPHKPSMCTAFKCKLLREVEEGQLQLKDALHVVQQTRQLIHELDGQIPAGQADNFRKSLLEYLDKLQAATLATEADKVFRLKAGVLLVLFVQRFGLKGLFGTPGQEDSRQK